MYILRNFYTERLGEKEAKELAVFTILETSKMDPAVGEDIEMLIFPKGAKFKNIKETDIEEMKAHAAPLSKQFTEAQIKTVENIVEKRSQINDLWQKHYGFKLFLPNEQAIFQIMKPCRSAEEFHYNIGSLALLINQINVKKMKKTTDEKTGSINILGEFLGKKYDSYPSEIISNLRDIMTMRSKKFPTHVTDIKFVEVVIKLEREYPPNWSKFYLRALNLYKDSLNVFLKHLQKNQ